MGGLFKNKFFIIMAIVACVLTMAVIGLNLAGRSALVGEAARLIAYPFQSFVRLVSDGVRGFAAYFTEFDRLKEENAELRAQLEELQIDIAQAEKVREENDRLYGFFDLKRERMDFSMTDARVMSRQGGNYKSGLSISRGSFHGIERGMPVVGPGGDVVGFISEVGIFTSEVTLITQTSSSLGAVVERSGATGIVEGDFTLERDGLCRMALIDRDGDVAVGDRVITSGVGGVYPEGLDVGEVTEIVSDPFTRTLTAVIKPAADFDGLSIVMVITAFERIYG